jgi:hypothetical protein
MQKSYEVEQKWLKISDIIAVYNRSEYASPVFFSVNVVNVRKRITPYL